MKFIFAPFCFKVLLEMFTSMSRSAPKACARSQYTPMLAPEKGTVWSMNYKEQIIL